MTISIPHLQKKPFINLKQTLPLIGVEPSQQGKGHGSALMQQVLQQCDGDRIPAYLEASKPANVPFYERHGFDLLGTIQVGASPGIFSMMRQPQ